MSSIFFQVWTKYLVMYIYIQSRIKRREKTVEKFPLNKTIKIMEVLRQNVGIDMAKDSFVATFTVLLKGQIVNHKRTKKFQNNINGFEEFYNWCKKLQEKITAVNFTMEATGIYYECLAYYLFEKKLTVHVLLPNKAKKFAESLNIKSKTDKIDSKILGQMGAERVLEKWELSSKIYRRLRTLTRERQQIVEVRTMVKNQLHAEKHSGDPIKTTLTRMKNHIKYLSNKIEVIEKEITNLVSKDDFISEKVKKITTTPGLSFITVVTVIAETQGFSNISSIKQLISYAGYDVRIRESGKWKGKSRISKKGNSHIRRALYMPSLSAIQHSKTYGAFYERLKEKKEIKLIAITAVQRKLLGLIYILWKNDTEYIEYYEMKKSQIRKNIISGNDEPKLSFCFLRSKKSSEGRRSLTTQDRLRYKESPKAFFLQMQK